MEMEPINLQQSGAAGESAVAESTAAAGSAKTTAGGELGKDEFLQLLTLQLRNQDPLNPMDSTDMIAQLAQFSALEQMSNLNVSMEAMKTAQNLTDALLLQGKNVNIEFSDGSTVEGMIEKVLWSKGVMEFQINETVYSTKDIASIALSEAPPAASAAAEEIE